MTTENSMNELTQSTFRNVECHVPSLNSYDGIHASSVVSGSARGGGGRGGIFLGYLVAFLILLTDWRRSSCLLPSATSLALVQAISPAIASGDELESTTGAFMDASDSNDGDGEELREGVEDDNSLCGGSCIISDESSNGGVQVFHMMPSGLLRDVSLPPCSWLGPARLDTSGCRAGFTLCSTPGYWRFSSGGGEGLKPNRSGIYLPFLDVSESICRRGSSCSS